MRRWVTTGIAAVGVAAVCLLGVLVTTGASSDNGSAAVVVNGITITEVDLKGSESIPDMGVTFQPPDHGTVPTVSFEQAVESLHTPSDAKSGEASIGLFSSDQFGLPKPTLVWRVTYSGVCVPIYGPGGQAADELPKCAGDEINALVDATTGKYLSSYAVSPPPG